MRITQLIFGLGFGLYVLGKLKHVVNKLNKNIEIRFPCEDRGGGGGAT